MFYKTLSSEVMHGNPWWKYIHDRYVLGDGREADYYYGETNGSGSAMIIPALDDGRLILISQYRYLRGRSSVEFPCGGLREGEMPAAGARRELLEEIGWQAEDFMKVGVFDGLNGLVKDATHVFVASGLSMAGQPRPDSTEEIEVLYRRLDEFEEMVKRGEIWDGQTLAAWALAREKVIHILT